MKEQILRNLYLVKSVISFTCERQCNNNNTVLLYCVITFAAIWYSAYRFRLNL